MRTYSALSGLAFEATVLKGRNMLTMGAAHRDMSMMGAASSETSWTQPHKERHSLMAIRYFALSGLSRKYYLFHRASPYAGR
jgi:hypothetical protein